MEYKLLIPTYLREYATNGRVKKDITSFSMVCSCGGTHFEVLRNRIEQEEDDVHFGILGSTSRIDKTGREYWQDYTFFGIPVGKRHYCDEMIIDPDVVKIKCLDCGEEIVVFHSKHHGYDGVCYQLNKQKYTMRCKADEDLEFYCARKKCGVIVEVRQDLPYAELEDEFGEKMSLDLYADLFGEIFIKGVSADGKIRTIACYETR